MAHETLADISGRLEQALCALFRCLLESAGRSSLISSGSPPVGIPTVGPCSSLQFVEDSAGHQQPPTSCIPGHEAYAFWNCHAEGVKLGFRNQIHENFRCKPQDVFVIPDLQPNVVSWPEVRLQVTPVSLLLVLGVGNISLPLTVRGNGRNDQISRC